MILMFLIALVGLAAAGYAHLNLAHYVATRNKLLVTRIILLVVGAAFGYVSATMYADAVLGLLAFLAGFGAVHIPPAVVLMVKRARHSPKS